MIISHIAFTQEFFGNETVAGICKILLKLLKELFGKCKILQVIIFFLKISATLHICDIALPCDIANPFMRIKNSSFFEFFHVI